jgi:hypothetical protein
MKNRGLLKQNYALAGVIEALLLIALVAMILSVIQLTYVPKIMDQKESDHMDQVSNQLSQVKSIIEIQSTMGIINEENQNITAVYTPSSSPLTLGSRELPYFVTTASSGQINLIDENDAIDYRIEIFPLGLEIPLTSIKFEALNYYFIPQKYILEGGALILNQSDGEVMKITPAINIKNESDPNIIEINYEIPIFIGSPGKKADGGFEVSYIRTNYITYYSYGPIYDPEIRIYTAYPEGWYHGLVGTNRGLLWEYCQENNYLDVELDRSTNPDRVKISVASGEKHLSLTLTIVEIGVQIGPGIIV